MKKLFLAVLLVIPSIFSAQDYTAEFVKTTTYNIGSTNSENGEVKTYSNFSTTLTLAQMFTCTLGIPGGTGGGTLSITNNVLTLAFNNSEAGTFCKLKTGLIKALDTSPALPDMDLGPITASKGGVPNYSYSARIIAGSLYFYSTETLSYVGNDDIITATFTGTPAYYGFNFITVPLTCTGKGAPTEGAMGFQVSGNTITLFPDIDWTQNCKITIGIIADLATIGITLPDTELGNIKSYGLPTVYYAKIANNKLVFYTNQVIAPLATTTTYNPASFCLNGYNNSLIAGESLTYYDDFGNPLLSLSSDKENKKIWGKSYTYDSFFRPLKESFVAPLPGCSAFEYVDMFSSVSGLANYYSDNNSYEPYQATATDPYSQVNYDKLNPGNVINVVGGNKINNDWKTGYSFTVPAAQEMYYIYGYNYFDDLLDLTNNTENIISQYNKTVSIDANGIENVVFSDDDGRVLATARSNGGVLYPVYPVYSLIGTQGYVDVHIPTGVAAGQLLGVYTDYKVFDLKTGDPVTLTSVSLPSGKAYRIVALVPPTANPDVRVTNVATGGTLSYTTGAKGISYNVNYYDYSVNVYNKSGQLIRNVQPKGCTLGSPVKILGTPAYMSATTGLFTTYTYDALGQLISSKSPEETEATKYVYRKDGQIRYSQNAQQKVDGRISYIDYDTFGRPIESGLIANTWTAVQSVSPGPDGVLISGARTEQTFTVYDYTANTTYPMPTTKRLGDLLGATISPFYTQKNLSGNVAFTFMKPTEASEITAMTYYSYDLYGRVEWVVQYNSELGTKTIDYEYDTKGNTKKVIYQKNTSTDLFAHQYTYNENDAIKTVGISKTNSAFTTIAEYSYSMTGQLKRTYLNEVGQGLDYVYTLGGMLKSINNPNLPSDPGGDTNDVFGMTLDYYDGDYSRTGTGIVTSASVPGVNPNLYNGNIKAVRWTNTAAGDDPTKNSAYLYTYYNNNWLQAATYATIQNSVTSTSTKFAEKKIGYDANGNISGLTRANETGTVTDDMVYNYNAGTNQLNFIKESAAATPTNLTDIENQATGNYKYDAVGQLSTNLLENLKYTYNSRGQVVAVLTPSNGKLAVFEYNEIGQRIIKRSFGTLEPHSPLSTTYYTYDLSDNVMAVYTKPSGGTATLTEIPLYGSSRLGVYINGTNYYEISDHLGNVRTVVSKPGTSLITDSFADYYPYGEVLPTRNLFSKYRYAFQGQELDPETGMEAFKMRLWDGRIGRWLGKDPYEQYDSPYLGMGNNPISRVDPDGGADVPPTDYVNNRTGEVLHIDDGVDITFQVNDFEFAMAKMFSTELTCNFKSSNGSYLTIGNFNFDTNKEYNAFFSDIKWSRDATQLGFFDWFKHPNLRESNIQADSGMIEYIEGSGAANVMKELDVAKAFKHAIKIEKGGLSPVGRALQKHPNILRLIDGSIIITKNAQRNSISTQALKYIMRNGTKTRNLANPLFVDYKLASGLGARFNSATNEFIGYLGRGL